MEGSAKGGKPKAEAGRTPVRKSASAPDVETPLEQRLTEAREQQAATSEILRVISDSRSDVQPVFDAIVRSAVRLCAADHSIAARFDGELLHPLARYGFSPEALKLAESMFPMRPGRGNMLGRAALSKEVDNLPDMLADGDYSREFAIAGGWRSGLGVPILRDGELIGAIAVSRREPGAFPDHLVALLKTFADQAVIAIENVRLFNALEGRNAGLAEALEQQTATSEILRVIASSPTDTQPVFDLLAQRAGRLCNAEVAVVSRYGGAMVIELAAIDGVTAEAVKIVRGLYPMQVTAQTVTARTIRNAQVVQYADVLDDKEYEYGIKNFAVAARYRAGLGVPIVRDGRVISSIFVGRATPGLFSDSQVGLLKTFADQAVIAIENVRLFTELKARNSALSQSLAQQTATAEILRAISASPTDVQPVFDIIAEHAEKLCDAEVAVVARLDREQINLVALHGIVPEGVEAIGRAFPMRMNADTVTARVVRNRAVVHVADVLSDPGYETKDAARAAHFRSCLGVPMIRDGAVIGSIFVGNSKPGLFAETHIELLKTFADQAVIAIENVRLFTELGARNTELTEALEQQTATSEILRVIGHSQTDVQPVFDTIVTAALRLCGATCANVLTFDGELVHIAALVNVTSEGEEIVRRLHPRPLSRAMAGPRAILDGRMVMIPDVLEDAEYGPGAAVAAGGFRSILAVPLLRDGTPIGTIVVGRSERGPFPNEQVTLLQTFADQAVIAIENVRLFKALEARNIELTDALEQQTATSEILRVISGSPTDVQPVFNAIARNAVALCGSLFANVFRFDGELLHWVASEGYRAVPALRSTYPMRPSVSQIAGRVILSNAAVHMEDALADPDYDQRFAIAGGWRRMLGVPMLRESQPIGVIVVGWAETGPIAAAQHELLNTFADQAVIAIENVRLFRELETRTTELTQSVGELRALGEIGQAVSSTLDVETVLRTIVSRANELSGMDGAAIYEYDEQHEEFHLRTVEGLPDELVAALRTTPIRKGEGALGGLAVIGEPVQVADIEDERMYHSRVRELLVKLRYRSLLAVPLLRDNHLLGGLVVNRRSAGEFAPEMIALLQTFASQSALAIQNARLFREIEDKSRQLEVASRHKSEFLANMSHELRTPLNAIIGFSEVLAEKMFGEVNDKQAEYLSDILSSGRHLLSLINDILDLSKIEAGRMELNLGDFDLPTAIDNTLMLVRERAHRGGIALTHVVDRGLGTFRADERKVKQVLLNLLSNALKFTPEGGRIDVRAGIIGESVEIAVSDTGVGIAPDDQLAVFEEFRQVGAAAKKEEGTGLGLAISRKFIELHGGKIRVESQPGKGSTFAFTLPLTCG